jgi:hypothetical protein
LDRRNCKVPPVSRVLRLHSSISAT